MAHVKPLPCPGDFITLEAPRERSAVAICVGHTRAGALRVRRLGRGQDWTVGPLAKAFLPERRRQPAFQTISTYRGTWRPLAVTDPRHPAFDPACDALLEDLGL